jgi:hypothetical protein
MNPFIMVYTNGWFIYPMDSFFMAIYYANSWMVYDGKKTNNG